MRIPRLLTALVAIIAVVIVIFIGLQFLQPALPLIDGAAFDDEVITPNADGENDLTTFRYTLTDNATISLALTDAEGNRFIFRDGQERVADDYNVLFNGIVNGYALPDETVHGDVERRLIPDGDYTWTLSAVDEAGATTEVSGTITVADADVQLPDIAGFSLSPKEFTPNQDGLSDRVSIEVYVAKDASLTMYLVNEEGQREYITERNEGRNFGEAGAHSFDYDGGIDAGQEPPADGEYLIVVTAEDEVGQRVRRTDMLTVRNGGFPLAAIFPQPTGTTVFYDNKPYDDSYLTEIESPGELIAVPDGVESIITDSEVVVQGDMLVFRLIVTNDGSIGLRTTGPPPGTVYQQDQRASGIGWYDESGAWRIGLECDTVKSSYPWRWAIGSAEDLVTVEEGGETYTYLPPGAQAVVWGGVRLTDILTQRNPQPCWFGLIHEDVAVKQANVDRRWVEIQEGPESSGG
ncbi:hypothetical protein ACFLYO_01170 [Chloroflexota bacterium]